MISKLSYSKIPILHNIYCFRFNLEKTFTNDSINAIDEADIIGVIHDVSNRYTRNHLDPKVLRLLHLYSHKDSFLVLNKVGVNLKSED